MRIRLTRDVGQIPSGTDFLVEAVFRSDQPADSAYVISSGVKIPFACAEELPEQAPQFQTLGTIQSGGHG